MPKKKKKAKDKDKKVKTGGDYDDEEDELTADEYFSKSEAEDSEGEKKKQNITLYCKQTHYVVIKEAGKVFLEYHLTRKEKSDWDIAWFDGAINIQFLKNMKLH